MGRVDLIKKHVESIKWIRDELIEFDETIPPIMGVGDWDDAVCLDFSGRLLASSDGPYAKRLVMKSALIHASTDILAKGGRPLFALDCAAGPIEDVREMIDSIRIQGRHMKIPVLGGNTRIEDCSPSMSITVLGELIIEEPIRDSGARKGDILCLVGEPLWGGRGERIEKAKRMFDCWLEAIQSIQVDCAKDVTKGGLVATVHEIGEKSGRTMRLEQDPPYPVSRNLDNILAAVSEPEVDRLEGICLSHHVSFNRIGVVE